MEQPAHSDAVLPEKARTYLPGGSFGNAGSDLVIVEGSGGRVRDSQGKEYVDFLLGSGPMPIGHRHPEVIEVVREQLDCGATFFANSAPGILCTVGRVVGGGLPLADLAGREEIMSQFDRDKVGDEGFLPQIGTLSGNPIAAIAGLATLGVLREGDACARSFDTGRRLTEGLAAISHRFTAADADLPIFAALNAVRVFRVPLASQARSVLSSTPARPNSRSPFENRHLHALASRIGEILRLAKAMRDAGVEAQVRGEPCVFGIVFSGQPVVDYRCPMSDDKDKAARLAAMLRESGVLEGMRFYVSLDHTREDVDHAIGAFESVAAELARH